MFRNGHITRTQFQAAMAHHQCNVIAEIAEARRNPVLAYLDDRLSRHAASRLERRHGEGFIRQILCALAELDGFPPAQLLWNAGHRDVPLHCFFRVRREPVFRVLQLKRDPLVVILEVEHGRAPRRHTTRESIVLTRDRYGKLVAGVRRR